MATRKDSLGREETVKQSYDAIIVGAGVIGACTAFEMAKKSWKTLSIDKLPEAGYVSLCVNLSLDTTCLG
jgi:2-polyprenyl-6-methoxyphenol hydroxylase-like FAD-dependent oxidoreductase